MTQEESRNSFAARENQCCKGSPRSATVPCCGSSSTPHPEGEKRRKHSWRDDTVTTPVGGIPRVTTQLHGGDRFGSCKARWGIGRMHYKIEPGLYAVGEPSPLSNVYVSANYKMSFDRLRSALHGHHGWILVLDTKGINVWCAAGKGTFGTDELVRQIEETRLTEVVSHRRLIVPQLGATGISAHRVMQRSGFRVIYGPVRSSDLPMFLDAGMKATREMRRVLFPLRDRIVLIPIELVGSAKYLMAILVFLFLVSGFGEGAYSFVLMARTGLMSALLFTVGYITGAAITPALLPWLPGRAFSAKGAWAGLLVLLIALGFSQGGFGLLENRMSIVAWFLLIPAVSSFLAMNFTGASTYTSLSGVQREMKFAVPLQAIAAVLGLGLWIGSRFA
jgi:hypothetical protein